VKLFNWRVNENFTIDIINVIEKNYVLYIVFIKNDIISLCNKKYLQNLI